MPAQSGGWSVSSLNPDYLFVFILAAFVGFQLIKKVSPLLHSPLMSLTNAIAAVVVVGAITITGEEGATPLAKTLGFIAVFCATVNLVSGFMITDRMLKMFKPRGK
nr:NAD(P) transhydrogenase subunit alpha [Sphingobium sp. TB-6]